MLLIIGSDCQMKEIQMVKKTKQAIFTLLSLIVIVNVTSLSIVLASDISRTPHPDVEDSKCSSRVQLQDEQATSESDNLAVKTLNQSTPEVVLPTETVLAIFSHIESPRDFTNAAGTCRLWRSVAADDTLHLSKDPSKLHEQLVDLSTIELYRLCLRGTLNAEDTDGPSSLFFYFLEYFQLDKTERIFKLKNDALSFDDENWEQELLSMFTPYLRALSIAASFHHSQAKRHWWVLETITLLLSQCSPTTALKELEKTMKKVRFPLTPVSNYQQYKDMLRAEMYQSIWKNRNYTRAMSIHEFLFPQVVRLGGDTTNQSLLPEILIKALQEMHLLDYEYKNSDDLQSRFLMAKNCKAFDPIFLYEASKWLGWLREVKQNEFEKVLNRLGVLTAINDRRLQNLFHIISMYECRGDASTDPSKKVKHYQMAAEYTNQSFKLLGDDVTAANFDKAIDIHLGAANHPTDANVKVKHYEMAASYYDQFILLSGNDVTAANFDKACNIHLDAANHPTDANVQVKHYEMAASYYDQFILLSGNDVTATNIDVAIKIHTNVAYRSTDANVQAAHRKMVADYYDQLIKLLGDDVTEANFDKAIDIHQDVAKYSTDANEKIKHLKMVAEYADQLIKFLGDDIPLYTLRRIVKTLFHVGRQSGLPNRAAEYSLRAIKMLEDRITINDMLLHRIFCVNDPKPYSSLEDINREFAKLNNTEDVKPTDAIIYKISFAYLYAKKGNQAKAEGLMDQVKAWAKAQTEDFRPLETILGEFSREDLLQGRNLLKDLRLAK